MMGKVEEYFPPYSRTGEWYATVAEDRMRSPVDDGMDTLFFRCMMLDTIGCLISLTLSLA